MQQRLLSSFEAFARSLKVHRATGVKQWEKERVAAADAVKGSERAAELFTTEPDADDDEHRSAAVT